MEAMAAARGLGVKPAGDGAPPTLPPTLERLEAITYADAEVCRSPTLPHTLYTEPRNVVELTWKLPEARMEMDTAPGPTPAPVPTLFPTNALDCPLA